MGDGGFTIDGLSPMGVVVEYVCSYTSVITGVTSQVRMKPNETADVSLEKVGGYVVQVRPQAMLIIATKVHVTMESVCKVFRLRTHNYE